MRSKLVVILVAVFASECWAAAPATRPSIQAPAGWKLVWNDEFDGTQIDRTKWDFDQGGRGWGNNELEFYTNRPENAYVRDGMLHIRANKESYKGAQYTSARLK